MTWRSGTLGAFRMGVDHGMYCVGCCWALMVLLFAGGVMNLAVIAALTVFVAFETLVPLGVWGSRATGLALLLARRGWPERSVESNWADATALERRIHRKTVE